MPSRTVLQILAVGCALVAASASNAAAQTSSSGGFLGGVFGHSSSPAPLPATDGAQNPDDPILIKNGPKKPSVEVYLSLANLYTETGKFTEAEDQYHQALKIAPDDIRVLLGYAKLRDRMNRPEEAIKLYQLAEQKHPKNASLYNDLAIHFVRYGMVPQAVEAAQRAVELRPHEPRFRNNLAALYVEAGKPQEAYQQLRAVYDEPIAHYDLGFLLNKRGLKPAALQEFATALQMSPGMGLARQWVERLSREQAQQQTALSTMPRPQTMVAPGPQYQRQYAPPMMAAQPQYVAPQQYGAAGPAPSQYSPQPQYVAPQQHPVPQYQPQYSQPPQQYPTLATAPTSAVPSNQVPARPVPTPAPSIAPPANAGSASTAPMTAARDQGAKLMHRSSPDASTIRRLPAVTADPPRNDPEAIPLAPNPPRDVRNSNPVAPNPPHDARDLDQIAPDPPELRR
jgi:Tfp pilus assembly protein PilF